MKQYVKEINIKTNSLHPFKRITEQVQFIVEDSGIKNGVVTIQSLHTTLAIKVTEDCKLAHADCEQMLNKIAPLDKDYFHDQLKFRDVPPEERINGSSHVKQCLMNTSVSLIIQKGFIMLGDWQEIFAVELDPARKRKILVSVIGK